MKSAIIVFPGSNRDRDMVMALETAVGRAPFQVWHGDTELPEVDLIVIPGGFSYGDYLRAGSMAAHSPIIREVRTHAEKGVHVLGVCNGFQILTEVGLLPGTLMLNQDMKFNIIIRSILNYKNMSEISAASGVVLDSSSKKEFNENFIKAKSLLELYK